jgi:hypothetical protein
VAKKRTKKQVVEASSGLSSLYEISFVFLTLIHTLKREVKMYSPSTPLLPPHLATSVVVDVCPTRCSVLCVCPSSVRVRRAPSHIIIASRLQLITHTHSLIMAQVTRRSIYRQHHPRQTRLTLRAHVTRLTLHNLWIQCFHVEGFLDGISSEDNNNNLSTCCVSPTSPCCLQ